MLTILGYLLIIVFMVLIIKKKVSAFSGLIVVSLICGILACLFTGVPIMKIFTWIREGLFYKVDAKGAITIGTISSTVMILFAILYFCIMMNVGLFDPLCIYLIKKAKGDPLKVIMVTVLTSSIVTLDGDGTTTTLIITSAFLHLYKQMGIKLSYLAMMIILPATLGNCLPWGGPLARAAAVINVDVNELFIKFLPCLVVAEIYVIIVAYFMGQKERKRLGYVSGKNEILSAEQLEEMVSVIRETDKELKRPKRFIFNFILTVSMLTILIMGLVSGAAIFAIGTAIALVINYDAKEQRERITVHGGEALSVTSIIIAAGCFMGIFTGSGMANAIATHLVGLIPQSLGSHTALIFSFIGAPACFMLPIDGYYFGILPVISQIAQGFGITPMEIGIASLMGQAIRYGSPLVAFLYLVIDKTELTFGDYQKVFFKYATPMFFIFLATAIINGTLPV